MFAQTDILQGIRDLTEKFRRDAVKFSITFGIIALFAVLMAVFVPEFYFFSNLMNILQQTSTVGILAIGAAFVLVGGGIDISLSATLTCAAIAGSMVMRDTQNVLVGLVVMIGVALLFGLLKAVAVAYLKMVPIIVTLSTMVVAEGLGTMLCQSKSVYGLPRGFIDVFTANVASVPVSVIVLIIIVVAAWLLLNKSIYGRRLFAIGNNENAAIVCGIKTRRIILCSYLIASGLAGVVAMLLTARLGSAATSMASVSINMDVLCGAILGGVSIYGGTGNAYGVFIGSVFVVAFSNVVNLTGISYFPSLIIKGVLVIIITYIDALKAKKLGGRL